MTPNTAAAHVLRAPDARAARLAAPCVLLSFLELGSGRESLESRSQVVALRRIVRRYRTMGLRVLALALERPGLQDQQVLRVTREWNLEDIPLLPDKGGGIATRYEVTTGPATFLLDQGRIVSRWNGFASAAELDRAIHDLLQQAPTAPPVRLLYDDGL